MALIPITIQRIVFCLIYFSNNSKLGQKDWVIINWLQVFAIFKPSHVNWFSTHGKANSDLQFDLYLLNVLENRSSILLIAISHVIKSVMIIDRNYLFIYIAQSNYFIHEILTALFLKKTWNTKAVASLLKL